MTEQKDITKELLDSIDSKYIVDSLHYHIESVRKSCKFYAARKDEVALRNAQNSYAILKRVLSTALMTSSKRY